MPALLGASRAWRRNHLLPSHREKNPDCRRSADVVLDTCCSRPLLPYSRKFTIAYLYRGELQRGQKCLVLIQYPRLYQVSTWSVMHATSRVLSSSWWPFVGVSHNGTG